jgi:hypothetical protein
MPPPLRLSDPRHERAPHERRGAEAVPQPRLEPGDRHEVLRRAWIGWSTGEVREERRHAIGDGGGRIDTEAIADLAARYAGVIVPGASYRRDARVPRDAFSPARRRLDREERRPLPDVEPRDEQALGVLEVDAAEALHDADDGRWRRVEEREGSVGEDEHSRIGSEPRGEKPLGLPHEVLQPDERRVGVGRGSGVGLVDEVLRSAADRDGRLHRAAAEHEPAADDVLAEGRALVAARASDGEGPEEAGDAPPIGIGEEAQIDASHAVNEPHRHTLNNPRAQRPAPALHLDVRVDDGVRLVYPHVEAHTVLGHPWIGTEDEHRAV